MSLTSELLRDLQGAFFSGIGVPLYQPETFARVEPRAQESYYIEFSALFPPGYLAVVHRHAGSEPDAPYARYLSKNLAALGYAFEDGRSTISGGEGNTLGQMFVNGFAKATHQPGALTAELAAILPRHMSYHGMAAMDVPAARGLQHQT